MMTRGAEEVPIVKDAAFFVNAERARLDAIKGISVATSDVDRLEHVLLVTNLLEKQIDAVSDDVMDELRDRQDEEGAEEASSWIDEWLDEASASFQHWAPEQRRLIDLVGRSVAQDLADGPVQERLQAVYDRTLVDLKQRVATLQAVAGIKTCPDCAEDVKLEARKCRFCNYRFDTMESA